MSEGTITIPVGLVGLITWNAEALRSDARILRWLASWGWPLLALANLACALADEIDRVEGTA